MSGADTELHAFWLGTVPGIGTVKAERLVRAAGGLDALWRMKREDLAKFSVLREAELDRLVESRDAEAVRRRYEELQKRGIRFLTRYGEGYPEKLKHMANPPFPLYVMGELPDSGRLSVAIVGARECSCYGRDMARMFAFRLAKAGVQVISGMARGVDGWAHQGALEGGGKTFAVLGCGVDVCYPAAHARLYASIKRRGGLLSEYSPGLRAMPRFFPARNRIISGLSDGILLVEARERSGSLITVEAALEQGRDVFVIPGRIGDELSVGCNRMILEGAVPVLSPEDILDYYQVEAPYNIEGTGTETHGGEDAGRDGGERTGASLDELLYRKLLGGPLHVDLLCAETKTGMTEVMKALLRLKKNGKVRELSRGFYEPSR